MIIDLTVDGQDYKVDISNNLKLLGELIINEIKKQIRIMILIGNKTGAGSYLQRWYSKADSSGLKVESGVDYSTYLEFGTFALGNLYSSTTFPEKASLSKHFKKKDLPREIAKILPKGMIPFAPVRRVIFNQQIMKKLVKQAFAAGV